jgi:hypothetical protein
VRTINSRCPYLFTILSLIVLGIFLIISGIYADEENTQQKKDAEQLTPQGTFPELPSLPQHDRKFPSAPALTPSAPENQGAINPRTGEYYPPSGQGFINPRTGAYYPHASP